ncbi:MAG: Crp/Fnr family transcriptional regulator [Gammaproteobacteria bacterium]|nr:Crp/Fnr family transcriptional regulator [Gammaproteobacteria bacterium]TVQ48329.1 MAG: Crp/Fnr family transcriptional regulator [Gammaproteobacteria bacterium]
MSSETPAEHPCKPLLHRLQHFVDPGPDELAALALLTRDRRQATPNACLLREGDPGRTALLLCSGWALRQRTLADGRRQIMEFLLPGDMCDPGSFVTRRADSSVVAITAMQYARVPPDLLLETLRHAPGLGVCLWWMAAQHAAMMRSHLLAVGRMNARERIAHLVWELACRLDLLHDRPPRVYRLPISQELIADAVGLSVVHVSRTLCALERDGILHRHGHHWQILSRRRLRALANLPVAWPQRLPASLHDAPTALQPRTPSTRAVKPGETPQSTS